MLEVFWYAVLGAAMLFYVILDGFDLGVGMLHLLDKKDEHRRLRLNAIGPVWDGNEVWMVIVVGGMLAGFPDVYATVLSGFYLLFMCLIAALIFRAVAIEFRSKLPSPIWRSFWDGAFSLASFLIAFVLGVLLANIIQGIPLNGERIYEGSFLDFFTPYSLMMGLTSCSLFTMHGALFLGMKLEQEALILVRRWIFAALFIFLGLYCLATAWTVLTIPHMTLRFFQHPWLIVIPIFALILFFQIYLQAKKAYYGRAFIASCISIALLLSLYSIGTFPVLVLSSINPEFSLTIYNAASSPKTLMLLLIVVAIGLPFVLAYGFWIYRIFRGKVTIHSMSY